MNAGFLIKGALKALLWLAILAWALSSIRWSLRYALGTPEPVGAASVLCLVAGFVVGLAVGRWRGLLIGLVAALASDLLMANSLYHSWPAYLSRPSMMMSYVQTMMVYTGLFGGLGGLIGGFLTPDWHSRVKVEDEQSTSLEGARRRKLPPTLSPSLAVALAWTAVTWGIGLLIWGYSVHESLDYAMHLVRSDLSRGALTRAEADRAIGEMIAGEVAFGAMVVGIWAGGAAFAICLSRLPGWLRRAALMLVGAALVAFGILVIR